MHVNKPAILNVDSDYGINMNIAFTTTCNSINLRLLGVGQVALRVVLRMSTVLVKRAWTCVTKPRAPTDPHVKCTRRSPWRS